MLEYFSFPYRKGEKGGGKEGRRKKRGGTTIVIHLGDRNALRLQREGERGGRVGEEERITFCCLYREKEKGGEGGGRRARIAARARPIQSKKKGKRKRPPEYCGYTNPHKSNFSFSYDKKGKEGKERETISPAASAALRLSHLQREKKKGKKGGRREEKFELNERLVRTLPL